MSNKIKIRSKIKRAFKFYCNINNKSFISKNLVLYINTKKEELIHKQLLSLIMLFSINI